MNIFKIFFSSIVITIFILYFMLIMFFVLLNVSKFFLKDLCYGISSTIQIDNNKLMSKFKNKESNILIQMKDTTDYLLNHAYVSFNKIIIYFKFSNIFSLEQIKKRFNDMINKLMHQSCDLLNADLIANTTTVVELDIQSDDEIYWVIQLGAMKNFKNVSEIVATLKMYNYPVYILPEYPVFGELVRIFVGPNSSKEKLEYMLNDLYHLSHLHGKIYLYPKN